MRAALLLPLLLAMTLSGQNRLTGNRSATRSEVAAKNGVVCTSQPLATEIGLEILKRGGSAVDAAIAANAMLCLTEPTGCGLGGDLFAIVYQAEGKRLWGLNASGRSPKSLALSKLRELVAAAGE
ncbi:MAG: gamma-glutamyltransferase, partial [Planctomycetota bacterium]|nr:gamma-glutamyltransferase [Planctomycetota bacterium]